MTWAAGGKGCDLNSGVLLTVAIVVCVIALAALIALVLVIRRGASLLQGTAAREAPAQVPAQPAQAAEPEPAEARTADIPPGVPAVSAAPDPAAAAAAARQAEEVRAQAEQDAAAIVARAEASAAQADQSRREVETEIKTVKEEIRLLRADLERREVRLAEREQRMHEEARKADQRSDALDTVSRELDQQRAELQQLDAQRREVLERVAGLTADQARAELVAGIEYQAKREAALIIRDIEGEARKEGDKRARKIVTLAIQRVASEQTSESVVSVLHLPGDEMKGRIIGREGRNIRAFESVTGVNLIIDDTPEAVLLSCFDPVRREVGRLTLERLVLDGRIHPQRIEEAYERSKAEIEQLCVRAGEDALVDVGITEMHPELTNLLGRLRYRTSYGQNVLKHLIESAHIAGMMASELGLDPVLMKRCTVLHDIGKALTHEVQGSHALIGAEIARRYGESPDVVHAIEAHHNEVEVRTVEAVLTQAADAISGGRPGARRESLEAYVKRLERLEQIALSREGVEKVFAMQAGREVRIMVKPTDVDDIQAQVIARDVAKQVEEELTYPGQIRVTVVRESRATEFAR
ncbi:MAG TPA: ribonuclease Y [Streptosporangiaceae bacterium]|nr:ribonuclease Y [Streptosporangiaceae bacterium]